MACPRGAKPGSGGRVDWEGRKEGNRVDAGSGQRKTPRGNLGDAKGESGLLVSRRSLLVH
jgi:hypothetical protein